MEEIHVAAMIATEVPPKPLNDPTFSEEMIDLACMAVSEVVRNRVKGLSWPDTVIEVVFEPRAFSAVCREEYWRKACAGEWFPEHVIRCLEIWRKSEKSEITQGATHYYSPISMKPAYTEPSWWDNDREVEVPGLTGPYFRFMRKR